MRPFLILCAALGLATSASAQLPAVTVTPRGDAGTLDLASWNIENFGTDGCEPCQVQRVKETVRGAGIEVWGLQEIVDEADFAALLDSLEQDGFDGALGPDPQFGNQRLAFIYDTSVLSDVSVVTILEPEAFNFAYRPPLELSATATVDGVARALRIITIHAKAQGDAEDRERRQGASEALKAYTDGLLGQGIDVIVLGDFNDELTTSISGGTSPYANYVADANYRFATADLDAAGESTYCGFGEGESSCNGTLASTIDHVLYTATLSGGVVEGDRYDELLTDIVQYTTIVSDHLPVLVRIDLAEAVDADEAPAPRSVRLAVARPARDLVRLSLRLDAPAEATLDVFDARGRRVARLAQRGFAPGTSDVLWDTSGLAPGLYLVRLQAGAEVVARAVPVVR